MHPKFDENFANYFLKTKDKNKSFMVLKCPFLKIYATFFYRSLDYVNIGVERGGGIIKRYSPDRKLVILKLVVFLLSKTLNINNS